MGQVFSVHPGELGTSERALWSQLRSCDDALLSPYFDVRWLDHVAAVRSDARVAIIERDNQICGFMPLQTSRSRAGLPLGGALSDYQGVVGCVDPVDPCEIASAAGLGRYDFSNLLAHQHPFAAYHRSTSVSYLARFGKGFDAYAEDRRLAGSQVVKRLRQRRNKFERECGPVRLVWDTKDRGLYERLVSWKREQYARTRVPDLFGRRWASTLLDDLFERRGDDFGTALFALYAGDRLAALNLCLKSGSRLHAWFIAHDPELAVYSPGFLLFGDILRTAPEKGFTALDFGSGDYQFKQQLANDIITVASGYAGCGTVASKVRYVQYAARKLWEQAPVGRFKDLPARAMRRMDLLRGLAPSH